MRLSYALALSLVASIGLSLTALAAVTGHPSKPSDLSTRNLLTRPDFGGSPCSQGWQVEVAEVTCNPGPDFVWLNHNNTAGDPAVKQTLSGLVPGQKYSITIGWRGGDHGPIHGVTGARNVFAVDIDGKEIKRLTTSSNFTDWMTNDVPATKSSSATPIVFTATAASHTLRLRGEVGADGDVLVDWVQVTTEPMAGVYYKLQTQFQGDGKCLEGNQAASPVKGGAAFMDTCQNVSGQSFKFVPEGQYYRLKTQFQGDGKCLESNQGVSAGKTAPAFMDTCQNVSGQLWKLVPEGQYYRLKSQFQGDGKCLEGNQAASTVQNGAAFMDTCQNVSGQLWKLTPVR